MNTTQPPVQRAEKHLSPTPKSQIPCASSGTTAISESASQEIPKLRLSAMTSVPLPHKELIVDVSTVTDSPCSFLNRIICSDVMVGLRALPDGAADIAVTSPPYNLKNSTGGGAKRDKTRKISGGYDGHSDAMPHKEYVEWQRSILSELMRVTADDGAIFYNHKWRVQDGLLQDRQDIVSGFPVRQIIIWRRRGGFNYNPGYFLPTYEVIYLIAKRDFKLASKASGNSDIWEICQDSRNPHPAPFPEELAAKAIASTNAKVVLDPFMGSGTTATAAQSLHRDFIGIEQSPEYCEMASLRITGDKAWRIPAIKAGA
jgi:site-specific DNA-methyltransferase (adenine-specific)